MTLRQHAMLKMFTTPFSIEEALKFHQTTFGSLCRKKWIRFSLRTRHFELSAAGREQLALCSTLNFYRKHGSDRFSMYVDLNGPRQRIMAKRSQMSHAHAKAA